MSACSQLSPGATSRLARRAPCLKLYRTLGHHTVPHVAWLLSTPPRRVVLLAVEPLSITSPMFKPIICTLIVNEISGLNQNSRISTKIYSNSKSRTEFEFLFKFRRGLDEVSITKVVPKVLIYLQKTKILFF
jgi:hypothetical protein